MAAGMDHLTFTLDATTNSGNQAVIGSHEVHGQIEKIYVKPTTVASTGSFFLLISGGHAQTNELVFTKTDFSGTNPSVFYPRVLAQDNVAANISGANYSEYVKPVVAGRLGITVSGCGSPSNNAFDVWYSKLN